MYIHVHAQSNPLLDKGDKAFDKFNYEQAMYFYETALEASPDDASITRRIANTYRRMGQLNMSAEWYSKTLALDPTNANDMLFYAEALKSLQQYDEAIYWYENYAKLKPEDTRAKSHLKDKFYYKDLFADTLRYEMIHQRINNKMPVISASWFEDEKLLVSAINLENSKADDSNPFLDVYLCDLTPNGEITHPIKLDKKVNSKYHDGPAFYSFSQGMLYITRNNMKGGRPMRDKNGNVNLKIFQAKYTDGQWSNAQEWKYNDNNYSTGHPTLSKDGQTMYFVSTRPGGLGGSDIYVCYKNGDAWTEPENLGPAINTAGNEMFPFIGNEGNLYFTSDGHAGLGGLDIFISEYKNNAWQEARNMGAPINTNFDDFAMMYDKENNRGFFCSNRNGMGDDDIFSFKHIYMEQMMVAGTLRAGIPNVSLAGEKIAIKNLATGHTTYQRLDEFERFEFTAMAGEKVEVYMMNEEYFDPNSPAMTYSIPATVDDPYTNTGNNLVSLTKVPSHTGKLTRVEGEGLATAKTILTDQPTTSQTAANAVDKSRNEATASTTVTTKPTATATTTSSTSGTSDAQERYSKKLAEADALFAAGKYKEARLAYLSATAIKTGDEYAQNQIASIDQKLEEERLAQDRKKYESLIKEADGLYNSGKVDEAMNAYKSALSILLEEKYPKERIAAIEKSKREEQYAKNSGQASKTDFDILTPYIDLDGMDIDNVIFDYNKALIRKDDIPTLEKVATLMKEHPNTKLLIRAYCDSRGSQAYNQSLSMSRAMAVQGYLMQKGFKRDRFKAEWYGEQRSLNGCDDGVPCEEDEYEINRRCEFKLVEMK